jgi:hypothetical protein
MLTVRFYLSRHSLHFKKTKTVHSYVFQINEIITRSPNQISEATGRATQSECVPFSVLYSVYKHFDCDVLLQLLSEL